MTEASIFIAIGYLGTFLISASYAMALTNQSIRYVKTFLWLNLLGGIGLCFPTYLANTLITHVLNSFWIFIALAGLLTEYSAGKWNVPLKVNVGVAALALGSVLYLGIPGLYDATGFSWWARLGGMLAMLSFMLGYFTITQFSRTTWALPTYLLLSMSGNVLYAPLLIQDQNMPILALQAFCFVAGLIKLITMYWSQSPKTGVPASV